VDRFFNEKKITASSLAIGIAIILFAELVDVLFVDVFFFSLPGFSGASAHFLFQVLILLPLLYFFMFYPMRVLLRNREKVMDAIKEKDRELKKQADYALMFQEATGASATPVIITAAKPNTIIYVNRAWEQLTGYSFEEAKGKNPRFLQSGKTPPVVYEKMWDTLSKGKPFMTEEIVNRRKDGTEYQEQLVVSPIPKHGETAFYVGVFQDITRRKEIERAKTEFVSLAAHQLRTPVSIINWYAETLSGGDLGKLNATQRKYVEEIHHNSKRMGNLVAALLNASRVELGTFAVEPSSSDVVAIVDRALDDFKLQIKDKKLRVEKHYAKSLPVLMVDPRLVDIVMQNLFSNAVKYTPVGGGITCEISKNDSELVIAVRDTGVGIPEKDQPKIFTKLFRADNARAKDPDGTGIGLYISRAILEESGGRIWFTSKEHEGSSFFVAIPLSGMKKREGARELSPSR
jgi:PAS domain S-box-containing protein